MVSRRLALAAGAALLALSTCSNPIDFNAAVEDAVKAGKDMYLKVSSVSPVSNSATVKPSDHLVIQFDRAIDTATIAAADITIATTDPNDGDTPVTWAWSYNASTNELTVLPSALQSLTPYTVTVNAGAGLAGADASVMRNAYSWSFTTLNLPGGLMLIDGGAQYSTNDLYQVNLSFSWNLKADKIRYSLSSFAVDALTVVGHNWSSPSASESNFQLASAQGSQTIYYQFGCNDSTVSDVLQASIIVDTIHPNTPTGLSVSSDTLSVPTWSWTAGGGGNGIFGYSFNSGSSYGTTAATSHTKTTSFTFGSTYTLCVAERDDAGNWSPWSSGVAFTPAIYPLSGATRVPTSFTMCLPAHSSYYYRIYFGTSPEKMPMLAQGISGDTYAISGLSSYVTYYWKIQLYYGGSIMYTSDVLRFATGLTRL